MVEEFHAGVEELVGDEWKAVVGGVEALLRTGASNEAPVAASASLASASAILASDSSSLDSASTNLASASASLAFWRPSGSYWVHLAPLPALLQELMAIGKVQHVRTDLLYYACFRFAYLLVV